MNFYHKRNFDVPVTYPRLSRNRLSPWERKCKDQSTVSDNKRIKTKMADSMKKIFLWTQTKSPQPQVSTHLKCYVQKKQYTDNTLAHFDRKDVGPFSRKREDSRDVERRGTIIQRTVKNENHEREKKYLGTLVKGGLGLILKVRIIYKITKAKD